MGNGEWILVLMLLLGLIGTVLPVLPGMSLIFLSLFVYSWLDDWQTYSWLFLTVVGCLTGISFLLDYFAGVIGAKKYGVSAKGLAASFLGGVIGMFLLSFPGLILGALLGIIGIELWQKRTLKQALRVAAGLLMGSAAGIAVQFVLALIVVVWAVIKLVN